MRLEHIHEADLTRRQFLKAGGQAAAAAAAPQSMLKGLMPKSQTKTQDDPDVGYHGSYEFWEDMGLKEDDIHEAIRGISYDGSESLNDTLRQWKEKGIQLTPTKLVGVIKGYLSYEAYDDPYGFMMNVYTGEIQNLLNLTGKFIPKLTKQMMNRIGDHTMIRSLFDQFNGDDAFWDTLQNINFTNPNFGNMSSQTIEAFRADPAKGVNHLFQKGFINQNDVQNFYDHNQRFLDAESEYQQQESEKEKKHAQLGSEYELDSWRTQSTEFESKLRNSLLENLDDKDEFQPDYGFDIDTYLIEYWGASEASDIMLTDARHEGWVPNSSSSADQLEEIKTQFPEIYEAAIDFIRRTCQPPGH